ncbi:MAG: hypothetical protein L0Z62_11385, partial [Gemmataceae bacterium]|nr:hypothetical protein [Gemmataceae bacterium]
AAMLVKQGILTQADGDAIADGLQRIRKEIDQGKFEFQTALEDIHMNVESRLKELIQIVREQVGPVASFKQVGVVSRLPKTRSGKVLRGTMRQIADGEPYRVPPTIDDPATLDEVRSALERLGYAKETAAVGE